MTVRPRTLALMLAATAFLVSGMVLAFGGRRTPSLDDVGRLAGAGRWDEAQARLDVYLRAHPENARARLLRAKVALDRPDAAPLVALEHLRAVRARDRRTAAVVRVYEGFAFHRQQRYDRAIAAWEDALRIDPVVPEAGWGLLALYDLQGRRDEAHALAVRLFASEPDPQDRVRLLLEAARQDIESVAPGSVIGPFRAIYRANPDDLPNAVALGLALVHDSRADEGIAILREAVRRHPHEARAWDGLLTGLDDATLYEDFSAAVHSVPEPPAGDPRLLKHRGRAAQDLGDHAAAASAYRRAWEAEPANKVVLYRLARALRRAGNGDEAARLERRYRDFESAAQALQGVYFAAKNDPTLGKAPHSALYQHLAELRERMGRPDEARAWHQLVVGDDPANAASLAALERLGTTEGVALGAAARPPTPPSDPGS